MTPSDGEIQDVFGYDVSIDDDYALVGAAGKNDYAGAAYVYKFDETSWTEQDKLVASDVASEDQFGSSVSISDQYAIIGSIWDDSRRGSAYIFKRIGESWEEKQKLIASDGKSEDRFGWSVAG